LKVTYLKQKHWFFGGFTGTVFF